MRCLQYAPLWRATRGELCSKESRHTTHDSRELLSSREWPPMDVCNCKLVLKVRFSFLGLILIQGEKEKRSYVPIDLIGNPRSVPRCQWYCHVTGWELCPVAEI